MASVKQAHLPGHLVFDPTILEAMKVVTAYPPAVATARWTPLRSAGGFSGARLWRGVAADGREFALKAHPRTEVAGRLENVVHRWMTTARHAGLDFVPAVQQTRTGRTVVEHAGRSWDITSWMPGRADFHADPNDARLFAAVTALAQIQSSWASESATAPCPAILRRWQALLEWDELLGSGWRPRIEPADPVQPAAEAAWAKVPRAVRAIRPAISHWLREVVPIQPCVCDIWHDHILFEGDRVTGVIDFAAAKMDHVAVDLARLLGSLIPDDHERTTAAFALYESIRPLRNRELVGILDRTGTVAAVMNWLRWLFHDGREYADRGTVAKRLVGLAQRLDSIP